MKRTSTYFFVAAFGLLVWHYHLDPQGFVLSDLPNETRLSEGWVWWVGFIGIILIPLGLIKRQTENERIERRERRKAKTEESERRREEIADKIRVRWSAETGIPQYKR